VDDFRKKSFVLGEVFMKNKKIVFWGIVLILVILCGIGSFFYFWLVPPIYYTNEDFDIKTYISSTDKDMDGVDDQTDILSGAQEYIATKPKYKSKYYQTGYPDDEYGVCTDVVGQALLAAGYDLMELVDADIRLNREDYNIQVIDKNIDFRRVRNLYVYFQHTAISLSTDIHDIEAWQGGDIVVFKNHIGIVSDKRNRKGISLVIHHANPYQIRYEEDILEKSDIIGHFRIS